MYRDHMEPFKLSLLELSTPPLIILRWQRRVFDQYIQATIAQDQMYEKLIDCRQEKWLSFPKCNGSDMSE